MANRLHEPPPVPDATTAGRKVNGELVRLPAPSRRTMAAPLAVVTLSILPVRGGPCLQHKVRGSFDSVLRSPKLFMPLAVDLLNPSGRLILQNHSMRDVIRVTQLVQPFQLRGNIRLGAPARLP